MNSKFPVTTTLLKVQEVLTIIIGIIGGLIGLYAMAELDGFLGVIIIISTAAIVVLNLFFAELLKIFLEIEKNTRKS